VSTIENPWSDVSASPPYVAQVDQRALDDEVVRRLDLKLESLPVPWIGDPRDAKVVMLGLNPGWVADTPMLERGEYERQNRLGLTFQSDVPFWNLDERLAGTPGHGWWSRRLRLVIENVGLHAVQSEIACVQWFPYHSPRFRRLPFGLASQAYGFDLVRRAVARRAVIVLMRSRAYWEGSVPELVGVDVLEMKVPRSPYVTPRNLGVTGFELVCAALSSAV
jgi:hypothetical protein